MTQPGFLSAMLPVNTTRVIAIAGLAFSSFSTIAQVAAAPNDLARPLLAKFMQSSPVFVQNDGQWPDASIRFALSTRGVNAGVVESSVRFQVFRRDAHLPLVRPAAAPETESLRWDRGRPQPVPLQMKEFSATFVGGRAVMPVGEGQSQQRFHYHRGEPTQWGENVSSWRCVVYHGLYEGIDLRLTGRPAGIKYEFVVAPGADWRTIQIRYQGIEGLRLKEDGSLELNMGQGWAPLVDRPPEIYQEANGQRVNVAGRFALVDERTCAFAVTGRYDATQPLIVDPDLQWSRYLGGPSGDSVSAIAVDSAGNLVVAGSTSSSGWISGGFSTNLYGHSDAFVAKLSSTGAHLWSTYLSSTVYGPNCYSNGKGIAVDSEGNVVVTGDTFTTGIPSYCQAWAFKLSAAGSRLWFFSYMGRGNSQDHAKGIAVDSANNVVFAGTAWRTNLSGLGFPDAFVYKLNAQGHGLWLKYPYSSFGYTNSSGGSGIIVDSADNVLVTGGTTMCDSRYWTCSNSDVFITKYSASGIQLWTLSFGGTNDENGHAITVDSRDRVLVAGSTQSANWAGGGGFDESYSGNVDGFVARFSSAGGYTWSTYVGGTSNDWCSGIAVDSADNVLVCGNTESAGWVSRGFDTDFNGAQDAFVTKLNSAGAHLWSTYLGGTDDEQCGGIAVDRMDNIFVAGGTSSPGWASGTYEGGDAFVAMIGEGTNIGLRAYDGTGIVRISCEAPGPGGTLTSPLRISKNGTTYGILLVEPNAPDASKILQQTAAGVKAWKRLP